MKAQLVCDAITMAMWQRKTKAGLIVHSDQGVQHFITKKYYFEHIDYFLKWPMPIAFMLLGIFLFKRKRHIL